MVFPVCHSDKHFMIFSPDYQAEREKVFKIWEYSVSRDIFTLYILNVNVSSNNSRYGECSKISNTSPLLKSQDKQCRPRSDCFWRSSLIIVFPDCYSDKHFMNSSPDNQPEREKVFKIWEHSVSCDIYTLYILNVNVSSNNSHYSKCS